MAEALQAYCVKCRTQRAIKDPVPVFAANGAPGTRGVCSVCGTGLFRMGATPAHDGLPKPETAPRAASSKAKKPAGKRAAKSRTTTRRGARTTGQHGSLKTTTKRATTAKKTATKTVTAEDGRPVRRSGKLVIVESPAKAQSVGRYLGRGFTVKASKGHVRDLPEWRLAVDIERNFTPEYQVIKERRDVVNDIKKAAARAQEVYLATDPDREGEAIAWHVIAASGLDGVPVKRVVFHEITESAVQEAFNHPRAIDMNLVNAQQARRILDRLVGYKVSQLLWRKIRKGLSAGRVQSIAVRLIVEREREIQRFKPEEYWTLDARLSKTAVNGKNDTRPFVARLIAINGEEVQFGKEGDVTPHLAVLERSLYQVKDVTKGERVRRPSAPFTTSTLQQEASRRLGFSTGRTMMVAQQLYEGIELGGQGTTGLITYMRTDSTHVSKQAQHEARDYVRQRFGKEYVPPRPPEYRTRTKGAQEAHEAIRPTGVHHEPSAIKAFLTADQFKLYQLIWQRFVASQMASAIYDTVRVDIEAGEKAPFPYLFRVSGSTIKFQGFLALYEDTRDEDAAADDDEGRILPEIAAGERLKLHELLPEQHFTQPPPRFTEATLVKALEEYGIGRPSTYAPIVSTIQDREYVVKREKRLYPTEIGMQVNDLLVEHFPDVMDYHFTAGLEDHLDDIAEGKREWQPMLADFYTPFEKRLQTARETIQKEVEYVGRDCPVCGRPLIFKHGRYGKFIGCSGFPECRHTEPWVERLNIACPKCGKEHGGEIIVKRARSGKVFYGCNRYPDCDFTTWNKPLALPCPHCGGLLVEHNRTRARCLNCGKLVKRGEPEAESA